MMLPKHCAFLLFSLIFYAQVSAQNIEVVNATLVHHSEFNLSGETISNSKKVTELTLKSCNFVLNGQLDDPAQPAKIKLNGKTLSFFNLEYKRLENGNCLLKFGSTGAMIELH